MQTNTPNNRNELLAGMKQAPRTRAFASVVYFHPEPLDISTLAAEFERVRGAGFDSVRYHHFMNMTSGLVPTKMDQILDFTQADNWLEAARQAGIRVIFHLDHLVHRPGGRFSDTDARDETVRRYRDHESLLCWAAFGEPHGTTLRLTEADADGFSLWLQNRYGSPEELETSWNVYKRGGRLIECFENAWRIATPARATDDINGVNRSVLSYGAQRDVIRYRTEQSMELPIEFIRGVRELDPNHDFLIGSHQLFLNQPSLGWDVREWGQLAPLFGTSIHLSWHFEPVRGEVDVPVYLQARYTRDLNPWGTTSAYETTGGPVQHSGGYGNHMDRGLMRRLVMSYIAAGNDAIAFWSWNGRPGGWEAGEYGLLGLSGKLTEWGEEAGRLARALLANADELQSEPHVQKEPHEEPIAEDEGVGVRAADSAYRDVVGEPVAGVLLSWDSQAIQMLEPERHDLFDGQTEISSGSKISTSRAWIGASRVLVENQIPFRYFHLEQPDYLDPLRVPVLVAPHVRAIGDSGFRNLTEYVMAGGTLIADCTFAYYNSSGILRVPGPDSMHADLFGAWIDAVHDNRTGVVAFRGERVPRFFGTLELSGGKVIGHFADGSPAAVLHQVGDGTAILTAFELGEPSIASSNNAFARFVSDHVRAVLPPRWTTTVSTSFRRRTAGADHYFIVNDGPETDCVIRATDRRYRSATRVVPVVDHRQQDMVVTPEGVVICSIGARTAEWLRAW